VVNAWRKKTERSKPQMEKERRNENPNGKPLIYDIYLVSIVRGV
jgi:hypothetical protein